MSNEDVSNLRAASIKGFIWRFIQNVSTQLMSFIIQIVLARILLPSDFGIIALTSTFITILNVIVTTGFTSALIQKKEIDEIDKSSMFYFSLFVGIILYIIVFFSAPLLSYFYNEEQLTLVFRIQGISLLIASIFSVHNAIILRKLDFKKSFFAGFIAIICQGLVGIPLALNGFGVWSLVLGALVNTSVNCVLIMVLCKWIPKFKFSFHSIKRLFSFSSKVLAGNVLNAVYNSSKTLIIGKVYDTEIVGYYNKGYQFPTTMMNGIDGAMTTVLFSSLSKIQDDKQRFVSYLRKSMKMSLTIVVPMLCGMAAVADPMIKLLLTEKWGEAIPFVIITCAICLTWPLSARTQALNAIGKSGTNLIINIILKIIGIGLIFASIPFGVYVMCVSSLLSSIISFIIYSIIISKNFEYTIRQQVLDVLPIYFIGFTMFIMVYRLSSMLEINLALKLFILVIFGILIYVSLSFLFDLEGFKYLMNLIKKALNGRNNKKASSISVDKKTTNKTKRLFIDEHERKEHFYEKQED